ncbi:MAG TPA: ABC transporter ATP-binding protein [Bryobacteraceae bacterium]|nr:ABC transporter ATP-binding protein [Bryobacteraceae bacterium]
MPEPLLAVEQASVSYGSAQARTRALAGVTLNFMPGALTLVMGPSGSGKTTLLSVLGCLIRPDSGRVFVNGEETSKLSESSRTTMRRQNIGFIFQAFRLFHALSAFENVMMAAEVAGSRDSARKESARQMLTSLGLGDKLHLKPDELSGGEKQRVAIGRAVLANPRIVLADEPTASLDTQAGKKTCHILRRLADKEKRLVVVVSHDPRWKDFAHRTVILEDGQVIDDRGNTG